LCCQNPAAEKGSGVVLTSTALSVKLPNPLTLHENKETRPLFEAVGAWLFKHRTSLPVPLALALLLIPSIEAFSPKLVWLGTVFVAWGEGMRLWAVRHIGVISRTRSDRLGPLVETGPFALIRNPLYVGNIALWVGFALSARIVWLVPLFIVVLGIEYHAIVRWEEQLLTAHRGDEYRAYAARVPRWLPVVSLQSSVVSRPSAVTFSWRETLFSERGTLMAIAAGYLLLWMKSQV
jgi:protein-S-isoprenylcysteine O-methyltransferase Ste14